MTNKVRTIIKRDGTSTQYWEFVTTTSQHQHDTNFSLYVNSWVNGEDNGTYVSLNPEQATKLRDVLNAHLESMGQA